MKKEKILIIEDNPINLKLVSDILQSNGYEILTATEGLTGLNLLNQSYQEIGLILLDLQLPDINGIDVIKKINSDKKTKNIPILVISAHAMESDIKKSKEAGCLDYMTKPINIKEFLTRIKSIV